MIFENICKNVSLLVELDTYQYDGITILQYMVAVPCQSSLTFGILDALRASSCRQSVAGHALTLLQYIAVLHRFSKRMVSCPNRACFG